jgi:transcriptional regulator with XRE-family HTH domain/tetratricopeptide (TPR) repeat protein
MFPTQRERYIDKVANMANEELQADPTSVRVRERLEELRRDRRLTLKALSGRLSDLGRPMSVSTLSKIANGDRRVDVDDLVALALALDVSPNSILLPAEAGVGTEVHLTPTRVVDAERSWLWATSDNPVDGVDVFVSYADADEAWGRWIGAQLEVVGQRVRLQAADPPSGADVVAWMSRQMQAAVRTVAVCSAPYLDSYWRTPEWAGLVDGRTVTPLRVEDCTLPPALAAIGGRDLFGLDEPAAWQRLLEAVGLAAVARVAMAGVAGGPAAAAGAVPYPGRQPTTWNVPPRLAAFTDRRRLLDQVRAAMSGGAVVALHGLGGVGKTHLAVEYCYRHGRDHDLVWWVPAEQPGLVVESLDELAKRLRVAVAGHAEESARAVVELLRWGGGGRFARWLVVLDNAGVPTDGPDGAEVLGLLGAAAAGGGHVLVTSRNPGWSRLGTTVEVNVLPRDDAVGLLRARVEGLSEEQAGRVAEAVGDLPLALAQAGAWLAESGMSVGAYEDLLRRRTLDVLTRGTAPGQVPVVVTWTLALDEVGDPAAVMLVRLWAQLGPEPIPLDLFAAEVAGLLPEPLADAVRDPLVLGDAVARVCRLGLVRLVGGTVVMHRLVQTVLRDHTPDDERGRLCTAVVRLLAAAAVGDPDDPGNWPRYAQLYPHALAADLIGGDDPDGRAAVLRFADYLHARGDDRSGDRLARAARDHWAQTLGEDHPDTFVAAGHLAYMLRDRGEYPAARALAEDVRSRCRRVLGNDHPHTIRAGACLGSTLRGQGDYLAARDLFEDLLARCRRLLGDDHTDTISAMANLAATLRLQGDYPAARGLFQDVLSRRRRIRGEDHPDTISVMANLAATLRLQGDYPAARRLEEDVLSRCRRLLGEEHPYTISAVGNLAKTLRAQEDHPAVRDLFEDVLARRRRVLGDNHPHTADIRKELDDIGPDDIGPDDVGVDSSCMGHPRDTSSDPAKW